MYKQITSTCNAAKLANMDAHWEELQHEKQIASFFTTRQELLSASMAQFRIIIHHADFTNILQALRQANCNAPVLILNETTCQLSPNTWCKMELQNIFCFAQALDPVFPFFDANKLHQLDNYTITCIIRPMIHFRFTLATMERPYHDSTEAAQLFHWIEKQYMHWTGFDNYLKHAIKTIKYVENPILRRDFLNNCMLLQCEPQVCWTMVDAYNYDTICNDGFAALQNCKISTPQDEVHRAILCSGYEATAYRYMQKFAHLFKEKQLRYMLCLVARGCEGTTKNAQIHHTCVQQFKYGHQLVTEMGSPDCHHEEVTLLDNSLAYPLAIIDICKCTSDDADYAEDDGCIFCKP